MIAVVPALVAIVLAGIITVGLTRLTAVSAAERELRRDVESVAAVAQHLGVLTDAERRRLLQVYLRAEDADVVFLRGDRIDLPPAFGFLESMDLSPLRAGETISGRTGLVPGREILYAARLTRSGPRLSVLVVAQRGIPRLGELPGGGRLVLAAMLATGIAILLAAVLGRRLARPLRGLSGAAASVAHGTYGLEVQTDVGGEIGELVHDFNAMSRDLASARRREREFVMDVSHDLRTPLTSIRGFAEGMLDGTITRDDDRERAASVIVAEATRLERLVGDLLSLERLEAGQMSFSFEDVDLAGFLGEVISGRRPGFDQAGVGLRLVTTGTLPSVTTDPDRLAQAVGNLLDNALRYSPAGREVRVELAAAPDGLTTISVTDDGPGIEASHLSRVFERLYVSSRYPGERPSGSGLGLAIVARIMRALGGSVAVESDGSSGTTFVLTLPRGAAT